MKVRSLRIPEDLDRAIEYVSYVFPIGLAGIKCGRPRTYHIFREYKK